MKRATGARRGSVTRSVAVDIAAPEGQELVRQLASGADVFVENFKVGALARYGLDYGALAPGNPRLVYLSISAFGQDGPEAEGPGYDAMIQAMGGLMSITGVPDGEPGAGPQKVGVVTASEFLIRVQWIAVYADRADDEPAVGDLLLQPVDLRMICQ